MQMRIADYPNMKKSDRAKWHREIFGKAYPKTWDAPKEQITTEHFFKQLRAAINE